MDRRNENRKWKSVDDLWKECFDDHEAAIHVISSERQTDAFGRSRVSNTGQRLDNEFIYNLNNDQMDSSVNNGTLAHQANTRDILLSVSAAANGDFAKLSSYPVPYTPGNSQLIEITGVLDNADIGTGTCECFIRTSISGSAVEITYAQSTWDDLRDGIDWSLSQLWVMDFQSLKTGTIRFGMFVGGKTRYVKTIHNDNIRNSGYWQLANGPVYYHLYSDGTNSYMELGYGNANNAIGFRYKIAANASATMKAQCCTVKSEGGENIWNKPGFSRSADTGTTGRTASTTLVPIIAFRPKTTFNSLENLGIAIPKNYSIVTNNDIHYEILHDVTLTDPVWTDVDTNESMMEYDVSATAVTGGHKLHAGYAIGGQGQSSGGSAGLLGKTVMWDRQDDTTTGILAICAVRTGGSNATVYAELDWEEIR